MPEIIGNEVGEGSRQTVRQVPRFVIQSGLFEAVFLKDDFAAEVEPVAGINGFVVRRFVKSGEGGPQGMGPGSAGGVSEHAIPRGPLEHDRTGDPSVAAFGAADRKGEQPGFRKQERPGERMLVAIRTKKPCGGGGFAVFGDPDAFYLAIFVCGFVKEAFIPLVSEAAFQGGSGYDRKPGVTFTLDGLVDGTDGGSGSNVKGSAGKKGEDPGLQGERKVGADGLEVKWRDVRGCWGRYQASFTSG